VSTRQNGPDYVTTLTASDGYDVLSGHSLSLSFESGNTAKSVVDAIVSDLGVPVVLSSGVSSMLAKAFDTGFSFSGPIREALNKVAGFTGVTWSVQNGELQLLAPRAVVLSKVVSLSSTTGLVGTPERVAYKDERTGQAAFGWSVRSLLEPRLEPGGQLKVMSSRAPLAGQYRVMSVEHDGDTHGPTWNTTTEVEE
jgi:hypothetical protein